jgi:hypothetical protein
LFHPGTRAGPHSALIYLDSLRRLGPGEEKPRSQGHAHTVFKRALEHDNLLVAEATAKEIGHVSLVEALELTALIARKAPRRHPRVAARWLLRYLKRAARAQAQTVFPDRSAHAAQSTRFTPVLPPPNTALPQGGNAQIGKEARCEN